MFIRLESGVSHADVCLHGGELHSWVAGGHKLLWHRDPVWWDQSSPILFPIVGWANRGCIRVDGHSRRLSAHGFARQREFTVSSRNTSSVTLALTNSPDTLKVFPFLFRLSVTYTLRDTALAVEFMIENLDRRSMPYALGFHPAFCWPFNSVVRDDYTIVFEAEESSIIPVITSNGLISSRTRQIPMKGRTLNLTDELFASDALCFLSAKSRSFSLNAGHEGSSIVLEASGFPHLALWSRPRAPFVSMEAWTGHSDPEGFAGDLSEKPSMRILASGETASHSVRLLFREAS
nr:aldose 1-epimerase family protein [Bradyrhizobium sp. Ai1a-2]